LSVFIGPTPFSDAQFSGQEQNDLQPSKVLGDDAHGTGPNRRALAEEGVELVAPPLPQALAPELREGKFVFDPESETLTCPAGVVCSQRTYLSESESWLHRFPAAACRACELNASCAKGRGGRTLTVSCYYREHMAAYVYSQTPEYKQDMRTRALIEPKNGELARWHGLRRARDLRSREDHLPGRLHRPGGELQAVGPPGNRSHQGGQSCRGIVPQRGSCPFSWFGNLKVGNQGSDLPQDTALLPLLRAIRYQQLSPSVSPYRGSADHLVSRRSLGGQLLGN